MSKIFCLMGKSSSGKDTIYKSVREDNELKLVPLVGYTTRPKRSNETEGVEYHFINEAQLKAYQESNKVIEQRQYNTINGPWYYATIDDATIDLSKKDYVTIVTLEAYNSLVKYFGHKAIVPFYIEVEDGLRLERAIKRERQQSVPNYDEMCRRFLADNIDFSQENLKASGINRVYNNINLEECINEVKVAIKELL